MRTKTPRRLGMKRDVGNPTYLMFRMVRSGREVKSAVFGRDRHISV
jgi:hypothetical protein